MALEYLAQRVWDLSRGTLKIQVYPDGELGNEWECVESLQIGSLDMAKVSASTLENFVPEMALFSLPYVFEDEAHKWQVLEGPVGRQILEDCARYSLRGLCYYETGSRSFYLVNRRVTGPDDLRGLVIRVIPSYWSMRMIEIFGASPAPIVFRELADAFERGLVDGAENNLPTFRSAGHHRLCRYFVLDEHSSPPDVVVVSMETWSKLSKQQRMWLVSAAKASSNYHRKLWAEAMARDQQEVIRAGVEMVSVDRKAFRERVQPLYDELREHNPDLYALVKRVERDRTGPLEERTP